MKFDSKIIFIFMLALILFSITCVSAAQETDVADTLEICGSDEDIAVVNDLSADYSDNGVLKEDPQGDFVILREMIKNSAPGDVITLDRNYTFTEGLDDQDIDILRDGIDIDKDINNSQLHDLTIDGNGFTVNALGHKGFLVYDAYNINFVNLNIVNCDDGIHIMHQLNMMEDVSFKIDNCNFTNNVDTALSLFWNNVTVSNCNFFNNSVTGTTSAAIISYGKGTIIVNCTFIDNYANHWGSAIAFGNDVLRISNSVFLNNKAKFYEFVLDERDSVLGIYFKGYNTYINAIEAANFYDVIFNNVTYYNGNIVNTDDVPPVRSGFPGINVTVEVYRNNADGDLVGNFTFMTDDAGRVYCDLSALPHGNYFLKIYHIDDNYYTYGETTTSYTQNLGDFQILQKLIDNAHEGDVLNLYHNYTFTHGLDNESFKSYGIAVNKSLTINGNGFTIDAQNQIRIFDVTASDVTLTGITFINGYHALTGGAINWGPSSSNGTVSDCNFFNNSAALGGAIYWLGNSSRVLGSSFVDNCASMGSAIVYNVDLNILISNSTFLENKIQIINIGVTENTGDLEFTLISLNNYINAIYSYSDIVFEDVTYYNGKVVNSDDVAPVNSTSPADLNITVEVKSIESGEVVDKVNITTDLNGKAKYYFAERLPYGQYNYTAIHMDEKYYGPSDKLSGSFNQNLGDFGYMQYLIDDAEENSVITLTRNLTFTEGLDNDFIGGVIVNKNNLTIDGNGFTIDGLNKARTFKVNENIKNITFTNINFINGNVSTSDIYQPDQHGAAIYWSEGTSGNIFDCNFTNNYAEGEGGALFLLNTDNVHISGCNFINNTAGGGGAISIYGDDTYISNSRFIDNKAKPKDECFNDTVYEDGVLTFRFTAFENYINAIMADGTVVFDNVTYYNGAIVNSNDVPVVESYFEVGVPIIVEVFNSTGTLVDTAYLVSDESGSVVYDTGKLDVGDYSYNVCHPDDRYYSYINKSGNFIKSLIDPSFEMNITENPIYYGQTTVITHKLPDGATGTVRYYLFDGTELGNVAVGEDFTTPVLDADNYYIIANYSGDGKYASKEIGDLLIVNRAPSNITIISMTDDIIYGDQFNISFNIVNRSSYVSIVIKDEDGFIWEVDENVTGDTWSIDRAFIVGNYTVTIYNNNNPRADDPNYAPSNVSAKFTVSPRDLDINPDFVEEIYQSGEYTGVFYSPVSGYLQVVVGDVDLTKWGRKEIYANDTDEIWFNTFDSSLDVGDYNVSFAFEPYDFYNERPNLNYNNFTYNTTLSILERYSTVNITGVNNVSYGESPIVNFTSEKGYESLFLIIFKENMPVVFGPVQNATQVDDHYSINLDDYMQLDVGSYIVRLDDMMDPFSTSNASFSVDKANVNLSAVYDENAKELTVTLLSNVTGQPLKGANVVVKIGKYKSNVKIDATGQGKLSCEDIPLGTYDAVVYYKGSSRYNSSEISVNVPVKTGSNISAVYDDEAKELTVTLINNESGKGLKGAVVVVKFNNQKFTVDIDENGQGKLSTALLNPGNYTVSVLYRGGNKYYSSNITLNDVNIKSGSNISAVYDDGAKELTVTLVHNESGKALKGANVIVKVNGIKNKVYIDENGQGKLSLADLPSGDYVATIDYRGSSRYYPSNTTVEISIKADNGVLGAVNREYTSGSNGFEAIVKD